MKTIIQMIFLVLGIELSTKAQSPSLDFAFAIGGIGSEEGNALITDATGNVYVTGRFTDTVDFDPSPSVANLICTGYFGTYVAKYNSTGQYLWAFSFSNYWDEGFGITVDKSGNILLAGYFADTVDFDPSPGTANLISANDMDDAFIAKYNSSGQYQWAISMGSLEYNEGAYAIKTDNEGNVYAAGYFSDTADFDPSVSTANLVSSGGYDIFLAKYDSTGQYQWAIGMGEVNNEACNSITLDAAGNVYITGSFQNTVDFDPTIGTANLISAGGYDIFTAKYNSAGQYQWAFSAGAGSVLWEEGQGIIADDFGNIYVTGRFQGTNVDFDPSVGSATVTSLGSFWEDLFIAKYDTSGQFQWVINVGGTDSDLAHSIITDTSGNIYITGVFNLTADFDPGPDNASIAAMGPDIFVAKYDPNGQYQWAFNAGGNMWDVGHDIFIDISGNIYITGYFQGTGDFDPSLATVNLTSNGQNDIFIAKYSQCDSLNAIAFTYNNNILTISFSDTTLGATNWLWDFGDGNSSTLQNPIHTYSTSGNYVICLTVFNDCSSLTTCDSLALFPTGINEIDYNINVSTIPNPFNNECVIKLNNTSAQVSGIEILNQMGQIVYENKTSEKEYRISNLSAKGIYFFRILSINNSALCTGKLIKE